MTVRRVIIRAHLFSLCTIFDLSQHFFKKKPFFYAISLEINSVYKVFALMVAAAG